MYIGLRVKYPWFLSDFNETLIFWTHLEKYSNIKFMKLIVAFSNFVNTLKMGFMDRDCRCGWWMEWTSDYA